MAWRQEGGTAGTMTRVRTVPVPLERVIRKCQVCRLRTVIPSLVAVTPPCVGLHGV